MQTGLTALEILDRLVGFPSVSSRSNRDIAGWIVGYLRDLGFAVVEVPSADGQKVGLFARVGPAGDGGLLLSAHMDVVPTEGQAWTRDPFRLTRDGGRLYGRGTTDMKGFLASTLAAAADAARGKLDRPFLLSLSYDEELGCLGIRNMIGQLPAAHGRPAFCIVGEPTSMAIATGHKGKLALRAECRGQAGHSAMAPNYMNALHLAADMVGLVRAEQTRMVSEGAQDAAYDIPYSTLHVGRLSGGIALNIVPDRAALDFELRHLAADDPVVVVERLRHAAAALVTQAGHPAAGVEIEVLNAYPGLDTPLDAVAVQAARSALPAGTALTKVGYGTEAGFFAGQGISTVVCGPGNMAQGHQPDEYIEESQLAACAAMLTQLVSGLSA